MAFDIEAARADGFSDEEIKAYLASQGQPMPGEQTVQAMPAAVPDQPLDRSEEKIALAQGIGAEVAKYGAGVGAAGYGLKKVADIVRGPVAPAPEVPPGATQRALGNLAGGANKVTMPAAAPSPVNPPTASPSYTAPAVAPAAAEATQMSAARNVVQKLALSKILPAAQMAAGLFYTSPEEIAILKQAEARKKAGMQ